MPASPSTTITLRGRHRRAVRARLESARAPRRVRGNPARGTRRHLLLPREQSDRTPLFKPHDRVMRSAFRLTTLASFDFDEEVATDERTARTSFSYMAPGPTGQLERRHRAPPGRRLPGASTQFPLNSLAETSRGCARYSSPGRPDDRRRALLRRPDHHALGTDAPNVVGRVYIGRI